MGRLGIILSTLFILVASAFPSRAESFAKVIGVLDGDTIEVLNGHHADRIRLSGIDCPENGQAYGKKEKQAASALIFGKNVTLQIHGKDKYGRMLADVLLTDGTNVNHELVKQGWWWWYRKYAPGDTLLEGLEQDAREARKGLWVDPAPIGSTGKLDEGKRSTRQTFCRCMVNLGVGLLLAAHHDLMRLSTLLV